MLYLDRALPDESDITVELYDGIEEVPNRSGNSPVVPLHQHHCYELTLILRGNCEHSFRGTRIPLIPGDMFLVPPEQPHAFFFRDTISFCNCQFDVCVLKAFSAALLHDMAAFDAPEAAPLQKRIQYLQALAQNHRPADNATLLRDRNVGAQGILHLGRADAEYCASVFKNMLLEQKEKNFGFVQLKRNLLEQLLLLMKRAQLQQIDRVSRQASWKEDMVDAIITQIDKNLSHAVDFESIAQQQGITMSYFRMIFKTVTGFSPMEYLNRVRILRALELLQTTDAPVAEIAMQVGVYDANYFSRLFKKIIGYPPSYYKAIQPPLDGY